MKTRCPASQRQACPSHTRKSMRSRNGRSSVGTPRVRDRCATGRGTSTPWTRGRTALLCAAPLARALLGCARSTSQTSPARSRVTTHRAKRRTSMLDEEGPRTPPAPHRAPPPPRGPDGTHAHPRNSPCTGTRGVRQAHASSRRSPSPSGRTHAHQGWTWDVGGSRPRAAEQCAGERSGGQQSCPTACRQSRCPVATRRPTPGIRRPRAQGTPDLQRAPPSCDTLTRRVITGRPPSRQRRGGGSHAQ